MSSDNGSSPSRPVSPVTALPDIRPQRFTWDSAPRKSGPGSVFSEATEGYGEYYASNAHLPFNFSSASLALPALPQDWISAKHGFHAISTVVNSPHKRSAPPKTHSSIPVVTPTILPRPNRKILDQYVQSISPEWERFQRNCPPGTEGDAAQTESSSGLLDASNSIPSFTGKELPSLDTIPAVFFDPQFNLGNPHTFNAVTDQDDGGETSDPSSLSHSIPLLEKFSHYADTIEQHLVREISLRSSSFFAALSNLQELQTESEQCIERISRLKSMLQEVDDKNAKPGLEIVRMESKLRNLSAVQDRVRGINSVVEMSGVARGLAAAGQWGEALGVIEELQALRDNELVSATSSTTNGASSKIASPVRQSPEDRLSPIQESPTSESASAPAANLISRQLGNISLSSLHALSSLPTHLQELTMEIATSLTNELVNVLRIDLVERIAGSSSPDSLNQTLKDRLRPLLQGLLRTHGLKDALLSWRETALGEVRGCIKLHLPFFNSEGDGTPSTDSDQGDKCASHLQSLTHADFMLLIRSVFKSLFNCVNGLQLENTIFLEVLGALKHPNFSVDMPALQEDLSDILSSAAELSNARASAVIILRSEQHIGLPLVDFLGFFNDSWNFVLKCEIVCRRMIVGLRGVIITQAKAFLQAFHQDRLSQSAKFVEDEQWNPAEVAPRFQRTIQQLIDFAVRDPPEFLVDPPLTSTQLAHDDSSTASPSRASKHVRIEDRSYFAVSATLETLDLLVDYLRLVSNLSLLTTDTMSRVVELLKSFNSRTCQVVLGAGAMRSAGLKNITAKHLALASQSLSIMISLIPYVRESFRRHLSDTQAVMLIEFDKLKRDYQEHQNEIHAKLITIMGDRLAAHIKSLQAMKWDVPPIKTGVNDYVELLVKETMTLHKVLSRYLSSAVVESVMSQVFAAINHGLSVEYAAIELPDQEAKDRLTADARYLHEKLSTLKNVSGASTAMLLTVISEKSTATQPKRANTTDRIKGLISRQTSIATEKASSLPPVIPVPPSPAPIPQLASLVSPPLLKKDGTHVTSVDTADTPLPTVSDGVVEKHENGVIPDTEDVQKITS